MAWAVVGVLAASKVVGQLATADLYGAHRDEFYYLESGHHLAWGYVDNPPLVPALYRLQEAAFGHSVTALAVAPALLGGVYVILAALITADLGGGRPAQTLAGLMGWLGPLFLTTSHFLSTVSLDIVFWALASWLVVRLVRTEETRLWPAVGVVCGVGLLNKDTMVFWAVAAGLGLLLTRQRVLLRSWWLAVGALIALSIVFSKLAVGSRPPLGDTGVPTKPPLRKLVYRSRAVRASATRHGDHRRHHRVGRRPPSLDPPGGVAVSAVAGLRLRGGVRAPPRPWGQGLLLGLLVPAPHRRGRSGHREIMVPAEPPARHRWSRRHRAADGAALHARRAPQLGRRRPLRHGKQGQ